MGRRREEEEGSDAAASGHLEKPRVGRQSIWRGEMVTGARKAEAATLRNRELTREAFIAFVREEWNPWQRWLRGSAVERLKDFARIATILAGIAHAPGCQPQAARHDPLLWNATYNAVQSTSQLQAPHQDRRGHRIQSLPVNGASGDTV